MTWVGVIVLCHTMAVESCSYIVSPTTFASKQACLKSAQHVTSHPDLTAAVVTVLCRKAYIVGDPFRMASREGRQWL